MTDPDSVERLIAEMRQWAASAKYAMFTGAARDVNNWADRLAALRDRHQTEQKKNEPAYDPIQHAVAHWFTQGGEAQFGDIGEPTNADELIAAILSKVRGGDGWHPIATAHDHEFGTYDICKICGQTEAAALKECHHCDEDMSRQNGRCWWCLRALPAAPPPIEGETT